jgi:hypothetical protein
MRIGISISITQPGAIGSVAPQIVLSGSRTVVENSDIGTVLGELSVENPPGGVTYTYTISSDPELLVTVNVDNVELDAEPDFETTPDFSFEVKATGSDASELFRVFTFIVVNEDEIAPTITTNDAFSVNEGVAWGTTLAADEPVTWTKTGGADAAKFVLSGADLSLVAKDFEDPDDTDLNNTYVVQVTATDAAGNATNKTITVTILNIDDTAPSFLSDDSVDVEGDDELAHTIEADEACTFTLVGGADVAHVELSGSMPATSVTLRWLSNGTKDYAAPDDADADRSYIVTVRATDASNNTTDQTITVNLTSPSTSDAMLRLVDTTDGFALVVPSDSLAVKDSTTPGNNFNGLASEYLETVQAKMGQDEDGNWIWSPHNFYVSSASPAANRNVTVSIGKSYTLSVVGTGSISTTGAAVGTATEGSPFSFIATTTTLSTTKTGTLSRAQINFGPVPTAYIQTASTTNARPGRFWNAAEGKYMIRHERQGTMVSVYSNDLTQAAWVATNITAVQDQIGPDGTPNGATRLTATGANGTILQTVTGSSTARTASGVVKRTVGTGTIEMTMDNGSTWLDITSQLGATWSRPFKTQTNLNPVFGYRMATPGDQIVVSGAVLETGSVLTSPWMTGSVVSTRVADAIRIVLTDIPSSSVQGTVAMRAILEETDGGRALWSIQDGTAESVNVFTSTTGGTRVNMTLVDGNVNQLPAPFNPGSNPDYVVGTSFHIASAWAANDVGFVKDQGTVATDSTATLPTISTAGSLMIGAQGTTGLLGINGWIEEFVYDPTRRVINDDLPFFSEGFPLYLQHLALPAGAANLTLDPPKADIESALETMTGVSFTVDQDYTTPGIKVALDTHPDVPSDIPALLAATGQRFNPFYIRGDKENIWIVARDNAGLSNGIYYYLQQLGCRWYLPNEKWHIIPTGKKIIHHIEDRVVVPVFSQRGMFGQGGFGSANPIDPVINSLASSNELSYNHRKWRGRNLALSQEFSDDGHRGELFTTTVAIRSILQASYTPVVSGQPWPAGTSWETILAHPTWINSNAWATVFPEWMGIVRNAAKTAYTVTPGSYFALYGFGRHPEYLAIIDGVREPWVSGAKLDLSKPGVVKLWVDWTVERLRVKRSGTLTSSSMSVGVECADGGRFSNNTEDLVAAGIGDGSVTDQNFWLANLCAVAAREAYSDATVHLYAYNQHTHTPSFPIEGNVIVRLIPYGFQREYTSPRTMIEDWADNASVNGATIGIYDYWNINDWENDKPAFNFKTILEDKLAYWADIGIDYFGVESTNASFPMGPGLWVAWQMSWDSSLDPVVLREEFYDDCFGVAKAPMKEMIERWSSRFVNDPAEFGLAYENLDAAMDLAVGNDVVLARIRDYAMYVHYLRLRVEYEEETDDVVQFAAQTALMEHMWNTYWDHMVSTYRQWQFLIDFGRDDAMEALFDWPPLTTDHGNWANIHELTDVEKDAILADGVLNYPPPDYDIISYDSTGYEWVPLTPQASWTPPDVGDEWTPEWIVKNPLFVWIDVPSGLEELPLWIRHSVDFTVNVIDWNENLVYTETWPGSEAAVDRTLGIELTSGPGRYKVELRPPNEEGFRVKWVKGLIASWGPFQAYSSIEGASPKMYIYVPAGVTKVVLYNSNGDSSFFNPTVRRSDDVQVVRTLVGKTSEYVVPAGHDDTVWSVDKIRAPNSQIRMLTVPETFAFSPEALMVPPDAL